MLVGYGLLSFLSPTPLFFSVTWPCDKTVLDLLLTLTMIFIDDTCCIEPLSCSEGDLSECTFLSGLLPLLSST